jgi:hypothetical protein
MPRPMRSAEIRFPSPEVIETYEDPVHEAEGMSSAAETTLYDVEDLHPEVRRAIERTMPRPCRWCRGEHALSDPCPGQLSAERASLEGVRAAGRRGEPSIRTLRAAIAERASGGGGGPPWWGAAVAHWFRMGILCSLVAIAVTLVLVAVLALAIYVRLTVGA